MSPIKIYILLLSSIALSSCGSSYTQIDSQPAGNAPSQDKSSSSFLAVRELIFAPRCVECHQAYNTYEGVIRELSAIQNSVESDQMPKTGGPLTREQKKVLADWIAKGAPNLEMTNPGPGNPNPRLPPQLEPTWASISLNIIGPKCMVCHSPQGQAKFLDLSTRQAIFNVRNKRFGFGSDEKAFLDFDEPSNSYLMDIVQDPIEPMPPLDSNIELLSAEELQVLTDWIGLGLP